MSLQAPDQRLLMEINDLSFSYPRRMFEKSESLFSIHNVSLEIKQGYRYGLIGESTCGKTTFGKLITLLLTKVNSGYIKFDGDNKSIFQYSKKEAREYHKRVQMIFQNPDASLNPGMKIGASIAEAVKSCPKQKRAKEDIQKKVKEYLSLIKLTDKEDNYPDVLSGGEKRRVSIIRSLALEPDLIVADEPFSSLDASLRNEMLSLLLDEMPNISYLFILHDLDVAKYVCDIIAVMYMGHLVEIGQKHHIFSGNAVRHPYTDTLLLVQDLLSSYQIEEMEDSLVPTMPKKDDCAFINRCSLHRKLNAQQKSRCDEVPELKIIEGNHKVACHFRS